MITTEQRIVILLVEDSADDVLFFHRAVHKSGLAAATFVAGDGVEAMDYLLNKGRFRDAASYPQPDLMFLDLKLPHVNGFEFLEWIRQRAEFPLPPVVILTSSNQPEDQERAQALGVALYLTKPPTPEQLLQAVQKCLPARLDEGRVIHGKYGISLKREN